MSHADPGPMAAYNSLQDRNLVGYFSNQRIRQHLRRSGLINRRGEIVTESTYRMAMARKEHQRHVRDLMAQTIVHKTLDMERHRQASIKNKLEEIAKVELVRKVRSERGRRGDEDIVPFLSPRAPSGRPNSASSHRRRSRTQPGRQRPVTAPTNKSSYNGQNIVYVDADGFPVHRERGSSTRSTSLTSGEIDSQNLRELDPRTLNEISLHLRPEDRDGLTPYRVDQAFKPQPPKPQSRRQRSRTKKKAVPNGVDGQRGKPKGKGKRVLHRKEPAYPHAGKLQTLCDVTVRYRGNNLKLQYEREDPRDEITVYQQHCGGENLLVFEGMAEPGTDLVFTSRRHRGYPFSVTFFVNRVQSLRLSACCEYKYTPHSLLGGARGHFKFIRVDGASPCYRCMVEAELARRERQRYRGTQTDQPDPPPEPTPERSVIATQTEEEEGSKAEYEDDFDEDQRGSGTENGGQEEESGSSADEEESREEGARGEISDDNFFDSDAPEGKQQRPRYTDSESEDVRSKVTQVGGSQGSSRSGSISEHLEQNIQSRTNLSESDREAREVSDDDDRSEVGTIKSSRSIDDEVGSKVIDGSTPRPGQETDKESDVEDDSNGRKSKLDTEVNNNDDDAVSITSKTEGQEISDVQDDGSPRSSRSSHQENLSGVARDGGEESQSDAQSGQRSEEDAETVADDTKQSHGGQSDKDGPETDSESELKNVNDDGSDSSDDELSTSAQSKSRTSGRNSEDDYRPLSATSASSDSDDGVDGREEETKLDRKLEPGAEEDPPASFQQEMDGNLDVVVKVDGFTVSKNGEGEEGHDSEEAKGAGAILEVLSVRQDYRNKERLALAKNEDGVVKLAGEDAPSRRSNDAANSEGQEDVIGGSSVMVNQDAGEPKQEYTKDDGHSSQKDGDGDSSRSDKARKKDDTSSREDRKEEEDGRKEEDGKLDENGHGEDDPQEVVEESLGGGDATRDEGPGGVTEGNAGAGISDWTTEQGDPGLAVRVGDLKDQGGMNEDDGGMNNREEQPEEITDGKASINDETTELGDPGPAVMEGSPEDGSGMNEDDGGMNHREEDSEEKTDGVVDRENDDAGTSGLKTDAEVSSLADEDSQRGTDGGTSAGESPRSGGDSKNSDQEAADTRSNSGESETSTSDVSESRPPVTVLNLNEKGITEEKALKLAASLLKPRYSQVQYLLVRGNPIGDRGLTAIVHSLIKLHKDGGPTDGSDGSGLQLTHLDLGDTQITNRGVNELAELIKLPTRLINVNLSDNPISRLGWLALAAGVRENSALKTLSVEYTALGDEGCRELCEAATDARRLTEINLEGNGIGEQGGEAILRMLRENERIATVNFERDNEIPAHISQEIKDML